MAVKCLLTLDGEISSCCCLAQTSSLWQRSNVGISPTLMNWRVIECCYFERVLWDNLFGIVNLQYIIHNPHSRIWIINSFQLKICFKKLFPPHFSVGIWRFKKKNVFHWPFCVHVKEKWCGQFKKYSIFKKNKRKIKNPCLYLNKDVVPSPNL